MSNNMHIPTILMIALLAILSGCQAETAQQKPAAIPPSSAEQPLAPAVKVATSTKATQKAPPSPAPQSLAGPVVKPVAASTTVTNEQGAAIKADDIRAEPFGDANIVGRLSTGDNVAILNSDGGWLQVNSQKGNGWVRMLSIRKGDAPKAGSASGVLGLASGRAGTGKVVATTGIRGLNEEELMTAQFNEAEVKLTDSYASSKSEAAEFAARGRLVARPFNYLAVAK